MDTWVIVLGGPHGANGQALELAGQVGGGARTLTMGLGPHASTRGGAVRVPVDRGTAPTLLLGIFHALARDPDATVVVVPGNLELEASDWLLEAIDAAVGSAEDAVSTVRLVAAESPSCLTTRRWLVPMYWGGEPWPLVHSVFRGGEVEVDQMTRLGALADTGILVAHGWTLATLIRERRYAWFQALRRSVWEPDHVDAAFSALETVDLFTDVLLPSLDQLRLVAARPHDDAPEFVVLPSRSRSPAWGEEGPAVA
ncbi:hypothetical protein LBMAG42_21620 [Deltaproteobacteria bacterium]|nr:hypothetical protein LBMAG42_21620 [Deltaproteobacteria bacterium]